MKLSYHLKLIAFTLTCLGFYCESLHAIKIKKVSHINYDYEVAFFLVDEDILIWDAKNFQLSVYRNHVPIKTLKLNKGQGPQDVQVLSNIISDADHYIIWDRRQRRFTFFNKNWEYKKVEKLPLMGNASPLAVNNKNYLFLWSDFLKTSKGSEIIQNIGIISPDGNKSSLKKSTGLFNNMGAINYDRPLLIAVYAKSSLYYANIQDYKVYAIDFKKKAQPICLKKDVKPIKWQDRFSELQYEIIKKPTAVPKSVYPAYLPPIFTILVNGDILAVVSNQAIMQKKSVIDFFKKGKYLGNVEIPMIFNQYFIFPSPFYFNPGICLKGNFLYTFNYDIEEDLYEIITWELQF